MVDAGANRLLAEDRPVHDWYRFVLSFPPHLVRDRLRQWWIGPYQRLLDPFAGTGTSLVEAKRAGVPSWGIEANPIAQFAASTKLDWTPDPDALASVADAVAQEAVRRLAEWGTKPPMALPVEQAELLLAGSISPLPLHKALVLGACITERNDPRFQAHLRLALARTAVAVSNLRFGPEVGVGAVKKVDAAVVGVWMSTVKAMSRDLGAVAPRVGTPASVLLGDSREAVLDIEPGSIDAVFTSPPYPNEKDYTRATRLESVLLGFVTGKLGLRALKRGLLRSNTRGVYKEDDDDRWAERFPRVQEIAAEIERRRVAMGKTSGFERLYPRVTRLYFGGMARHLASLRLLLRPGAQLGYVVGDQASYLRVLIRTGSILADIARDLGYEVRGVEVFRMRAATATREDLREEVVLLRWPG